MITKFHSVKLALSAIGTWAVCVTASILASWIMSHAFGVRFNLADIQHIVVLSTILVIIVGVTYWHRK